MPSPCPNCGDPLTRERCNITVHRQWQASEAVPHWFYTCETCGREYHGFERPFLRLVPVTLDDDDMAPVAVTWGWNDSANERTVTWPN